MGKTKKLLTLLISSFILISLFGCGMPDMELIEKNVEADKNGNLLDLIEVDDEDNKYSIEAKESDIDLGKCGDYTVNYIVYKKDRKIGEKEFKITVVDTTAPAIKVDENITIKKGSSKSDLIKLFDINENSSDDVDISIDGNYNLNQYGSYKISITAKDSSGNISTETTVLNVSDKDNDIDGRQALSANASDIKGYWKNKGEDILMIIQKEKNNYSNLKIVFSILSEGKASEAAGGSIKKLERSDNVYKITYIDSELGSVKITLEVDGDKLSLDSKYDTINGTYKRTTKEVLK